MTEQTDKELTDNSTPVEPVIPLIEADKINTEQPIETTKVNESMEVHHHAHHQENKGWKAYFWEFLMLFLAVFCGFLAEYQLEHKIEHDREKQYIESTIADMAEDSVKINNSITICSMQKAGFDSLLQNIYERPYTDSSLRVMYLIQLRYTHSRNSVIFTKRTITQLKNSGGLRLIRNKNVSDTIILYSEDCEQAEAQADYFEKVRMGRVNDYSIKLFDNQYILNYKGQRLNNPLDANSPIKLLDNDDKLMREYANTLTYARGSLANYILMLKAIKARIPSKIKFLKDKYH